MKFCIWLREVIKWDEPKDLVWDWKVVAGDGALPASQPWLQPEAEKSQKKVGRATFYLKVYTCL